MDHIVVDVEIQKCIGENGLTWDDTDKLLVAVACVWEYNGQRMRVYGPDDIEALRERLLNADRISGFNIFNFDFPVIWGIGKQDWMDGSGTAGHEAVSGKTRFNCSLKVLLERKTDDMLRRIWQAKGLDPDRFSPSTHGGVGLDAIATTTLNIGKIGHGADAPKWYQQGLIQKVANYCADDTCLERDLCDFIDKYGYIIQNGKKLNITKWNIGS